MSNFDAKNWIMKLFTIIWMLISFLIVIVFIATFTTAMTTYALNGQSLSKKLIGIQKFSYDSVWLELENAIPVGELIII